MTALRTLAAIWTWAFGYRCPCGRRMRLQEYARHLGGCPVVGR